MVSIAGADAHHLAHVLRLGIGDALRIVVEGDPPHAHAATVRSVTGSTLHCELKEEIEATNTASAPRLSVAQALFQDDIDVAVRGLSELGVDEILPFISERSVVRPDPGRQARRQARWQEIARHEAALGYHFAVASVAAVATFDALLAAAKPGIHCIVLDLDSTARPLVECLPPSTTAILLAIGPEGGFTDGERRKLSEASFQAAHLGPHTFRAQYAGIISAALVMAHYGAFAPPPA